MPRPRVSLPAVFAFVLPDNAASIAVLRRLGAQADGTVESSGLHCLRYRFDPDSTAAAEDLADDGRTDLQLIHRDTLTAVSEGRTVASAGWLLRDMAFDGSLRRAAGLGSAQLHPACRDQGIARTLVSVAVEHARAAGAETVVLLCRPDLVPFYTQLGWSEVSVPVAFRRPDGARSVPAVTMIYDLVGLPHPTVRVDLRGLPF